MRIQPYRQTNFRPNSISRMTLRTNSNLIRNLRRNGKKISKYERKSSKKNARNLAIKSIIKKLQRSGSGPSELKINSTKTEFITKSCNDDVWRRLLWRRAQRISNWIFKMQSIYYSFKWMNHYKRTWLVYVHKFWITNFRGRKILDNRNLLTWKVHVDSESENILMIKW